MLLQNEGLNEATVGELRMATSTLQEGDVARERASGQGARLFRGEEHKDYDAAVRLQKEVKKNDLKVQKEEVAKDTATRTVSESGVMVYRNCSKSFVCLQSFRTHEEGCVEQLARRTSNRKTAGLREVLDLAQDQVHSANTVRCACCQGRMGVQRDVWGQRWGLQEVPKGFSADTVQQQRGAKN
jgi:hypothetical protein